MNFTENVEKKSMRINTYFTITICSISTRNSSDLKYVLLDKNIINNITFNKF